jgi:hypothetical protein
VEGVIVVPFSKGARQLGSHLVDLQKHHVPVVCLSMNCLPIGLPRWSRTTSRRPTK